MAALTCIRGGTLVLPDGLKKADLWICDDKIAQIGGTVNGEYTAVEASGRLVFPGFIDAHTHLEMPVSGTVTADDFPFGTAAALAGGTTVILDFATQERGGTLAEALEIWHRRADGRCACDYGFHMAVTDWNESTCEQLRKMPEAGVTSFKAYMAYDALRISDEALREFFAATADIGPVGVHCELGDKVAEGVRAQLDAGCIGPEGHPKSRPNAVESAAVARCLQLAREGGGNAWIVHLSTREGLAEIEKARAAGQKILVETCPQYLTLTDEVYIKHDFEGAKYVCSPPIRSTEDKEKLISAVSAEEVDIISTDHCSFHFEGQKELGRGDFSKIPNGLPGIEHRPAVIWSALVSKGKLDPVQFARLLAENPARAFGLAHKGSLEVGKDADIVIWDPDYRGELRASEQVQNVDYSPWEGFALTGRAEKVYLRGVLSAECGRVLVPDGGKYLLRCPSVF